VSPACRLLVGTLAAAAAAVAAAAVAAAAVRRRDLPLARHSGGWELIDRAAADDLLVRQSCCVVG
jgi:hypothetical protein